MTPATLTALAAEYRPSMTPEVLHAWAKEAAAILEQVAGADAKPVRWEFRWTNPRGDELREGDTSMSWKGVEPAWNQTMEMACAELAAYRFEGRPCYEVRALYAHPPLTAQSSEGVALYEALKDARNDVADASTRYYDGVGGQQRRDEAIKRLAAVDAAIAAYEAKRGGVR